MSESPLPLAVITAAVIKTRKDVGTLGKAAVNPHGNYKYVSIDKYYEVVASAAAKNGLFWTISEVKSTLEGFQNAGGAQVEERTFLHESSTAIPRDSVIKRMNPDPSRPDLRRPGFLRALLPSSGWPSRVSLTQ